MKAASASSPPGRRVLRAGLVAAAVLVAVTVFVGRNHGLREQAVTVLDPASVRIVRTPGGMLEVATLQKVEAFGWQVSHQCPLVDCGELFGKTTSEIRVTAHYTYRIPLAEQLELRFASDHYELLVPQLQAKNPVAFDTAGMQIRTEKGTWLSPSAGPNREAVVRHLGAELARRAQRPEYLRAAEESAAATVAEFARKWMAEQIEVPRHPIRVRFGAAVPRGEPGSGA